MSVGVARQSYSTPQPSLRLEAPVLGRSRIADYLELTKPRISVLVLVTVAAGYLFAGGTGLGLFHTIFGTMLVAAGASAWNQLLERHTDAKMTRTANRPLPAGRLNVWEVGLFGSLLAIVGVGYLLWTIASPLAAILAGATFVLYVAVYTPAKGQTTWNTLIGAVPGALPPMIGWAAAQGRLPVEALPLFLVLFFWQLPHFYSIAWLYRKQYGEAGLHMVPVTDEAGSATSRGMIGYCLCLLAASLLPLVWGVGGWLYVGSACILGFGYLASSMKFRAARDDTTARRVLRTSLIYLPALLIGLLVDRALLG